LVQYIKGAKQLELIRKKNNIDSLVASRSGLETKSRKRRRNQTFGRAGRQADSAILRIANQIRRSTGSIKIMPAVQWCGRYQVQER